MDIRVINTAPAVTASFKYRMPSDRNRRLRPGLLPVARIEKRPLAERFWRKPYGLILESCD